MPLRFRQKIQEVPWEVSRSAPRASNLKRILNSGDCSYSYSMPYFCYVYSGYKEQVETAF